MIDLDDFPKSDAAKEMISYVTPGWYDKSYIGKWLFEVMGIELDAATGYIESLPEQLFPETATWGLRYHEEKYGLPVLENLPPEERRMRIYQKRDFRAPMTPYRMESYLENAMGFKVRIADCNDEGEFGYVPDHPNIFKVYFIGEDTLDTKKARQQLNKLKQSHTMYTINDMVMMELDNRRLEKLFLRRVLLHMRIPFFWNNLFDGTWDFDGSILMDGKRRYELHIGLKYDEGGTVAEETISSSVMLIKCKGNIEEGSGNVKAGFRIGINFLFSEEKYISRMSTKMYFAINNQIEKTDTVSVLVIRRDSWFFDGSVKLDGSKYFDSIYEKEAL